MDTNKGTPIKDLGITPSIGIGAEGTAESTTKSGIAEGEIVVKDKENQKQDIRELNREAKDNLNQLGEIFDKTKIEERQELAGLFGELAFNRIHELNGTEEQKAAYHALVASIMAKLTGGDMLSSAGSAAINNLNFAPLKRRKTSIKSREIQPFSFALCTILSDFPPDCR